MHMDAYGVVQARTQRNERTSMTRHKVDPVGLEAATAGAFIFSLKTYWGPGVPVPIEMLSLCCAASGERRWQSVQYR